MKQLLINNLFSNLDIIKKTINHQKICAVVKANAYGHGINSVVKLLRTKQCNIDYFAVSSFYEALEILPLSKKKILILSPVFNKELIQLAKIGTNNIEITITSLSDLNRILNLKLKTTLHLHLKLNCGFNRFGFKTTSQINKVLTKIKQHPNLKLCGIFMHISSSKTAQTECNKLLKFLKLHSLIEICNDILVHVGGVQSVNVINYLNFKLSKSYESNLTPPFKLMLRSGINIYGYGGEYFTNKLKPVMLITAKTLAIQQLKKGDSSGYNESFKAEKPSKIAVLKIGYADGFLRELKGISIPIIKKLKTNNKKNFLTKPNQLICFSKSPTYKCQFFKVVAVCMDYILIDITSSKNIKVGSQFEILGENNSANLYAKKLNTIPYEVLCNFSKLRNN